MTARGTWTILGLSGAVLVGVLAVRSLMDAGARSPEPSLPRSAGGHDDESLGQPDPLEPLEAEPGPEGPGHDPAERLCHALGCEPAQREVIEQAAAGYGRRAAELRDDIKALRAPLEPLLQGEAPDEAAARAIMLDLAEPRRALDEAALAAILAVHAVLTPAQRQKLARMVARRGPVAALEGSRKRGQGPSAD